MLAVDPNVALKPVASVVSAKSSVVVGEPAAACQTLRLVYVFTVSAKAELLANSSADPIMSPNTNFLIFSPSRGFMESWIELRFRLPYLKREHVAGRREAIEKRELTCQKIKMPGSDVHFIAESMQSRCSINSFLPAVGAVITTRNVETTTKPCSL